MKNPEEVVDDAKPRPPGRRKWKRWVVLALLAGGLLWLNGPGLRWLGPKIAGHFLEKAGLRGNFAIEGTLTGGLTMKDLDLTGDKALAKLRVGRLTLDYRLIPLMKGQLDGVAVDGLHADLRLGLKEKKPEEKEDPLNLKKLVETLRGVRSNVMQVEADLKDVSLNATRDGERVIALDRSRIRHKAGESDVDVEIGTFTDATGREWPARDSTVVWNVDDLTVDRLDPLPGLSVRNLIVRLPADGGLSAETELYVDDAVFVVNASPGLSSVQANLREGRLVSETLARRFNVELPASAALTSLALNVDRLLPDPKVATGSVQVLLENLAYQDWMVPEFSLDASLEDDVAAVAARGLALGTEFSVDAQAGVSRAEGGFQLGETRGRFQVAEVARLLEELADRVEAIDSDADVPVSTLDGEFGVEFAGNRPSSAEVKMNLTPAEPEVASALEARVRWTPDQQVSAVVALDGLSAEAGYNLESTGYQGQIAFEDFKSARIDRWLAIVKAGTKGAYALNGTWRGSGTVKGGTHLGTLSVSDAEVVREGVPPIHAQGEIEYDWPQGFSTKDVQVKAANQTVAVTLNMADGFLEISDLLWSDEGEQMAAGAARLPVPEDFTKWRAMIARDERPLEVSIQSKRLALTHLKDWLPAMEKLDPRSTGQIELRIEGTYAKPVVHVVVDTSGLRSPGMPELPPAELKVTVAGREGHAAVVGSLTTPDFRPAVFSASMPFRPAEWAEKPGLILEEDITARLDLPRVDLSRLATLVPGTRKLVGVVTGNAEVAGTLGEPVVKGRIDLAGGGLELTKGDIPAVSGLGASVDFALNRIELRELKATVAGGTLSAAGSLSIEGGKPGAMEVRLQGDHLPLKRDESLIVRANADLRLAGTWEQAALTGTVSVVDSIFFRDIELLPIGSPFTGPSAAALPKIDTPSKPEESVPEPFRNWTLNVAVKTANPFLIRGNLATGRVVADLRVGGTIGAPAPDGEVRIADFRASLPFSTLTVKSGALRFTPENGLDPALEIRGSAEPRPYRVNIYVHGRASDPQLVLTSSPPLPENEIMTLLATGTTTSGLEDPQAASSRAMQLLIEELRRGRLAGSKRLRPVLKMLDRVEFNLSEADPYSSESYSTATLQLSDRWYLVAGLGDEGDSRALAIWRLRFY